MDSLLPLRLGVVERRLELSDVLLGVPGKVPEKEELVNLSQR